jgi:hypothetical protein
VSYLNPLRLHFAGKFQATVSTVNNDPTHFDNDTFQPSFQDRQTAAAANGWFNPRGDADWRFIGCAVTGAWLGPARPAAADDPIRTYLIADSDRQVPAKLVDLDPEQQLVSMIWGLEVRIVTASGDTVLRGRFEPAAFMDIWSRSEGGGGDIGAGAMYQSVLTDLEWGDVSSSPFLTALQAAAGDGLLSVKFNTDSFNLTFRSPDFMRGRIVGTIGPAASDEPHHLVLGRQFLPICAPTAGFPVPSAQIYACVASVDAHARRIYLDLGNALPTSSPTDVPDPLGDIVLGCEVTRQDGSQVVVSLAQLPEPVYTDPAWYPTTAGMVELPSNRALTAGELRLIAGNPLVITTIVAPGAAPAGVAESPGGVFVRADQFVHMLSPGGSVDVPLYATQFGQRYPGARIIDVFDPSQLQPVGGPGLSLPVATPDSAVDFPARLTTDANGVAVLRISASDPGNPRGYIDGQIYGIRPVLEETVFQVPPYPFGQWDFVSVLVFDAFRADDPVTWWGSLQPILQQYENLYPVMLRFLRLGDYDSVCENREMLQYAFGLDEGNPNSMPVTRDLSPAKRAAILRWLTDVGADGKPLEGVRPTPPPAPGPGPLEVAAEPPTPTPTPPEGDPARGGKSAAAARRLALQRPVTDLRSRS